MCAVDNIPVFYLYWTGLLPNIFLYQHLLEIFMILKGCWDQLKSVERLHDLKATRESLLLIHDRQCPICLDEIDIGVCVDVNDYNMNNNNHINSNTNNKNINTTQDLTNNDNN